MAENTDKRQKLGETNFTFGQIELPDPDVKQIEDAINPIYAMVGRISGHWGLLELALDQTIWQVCGLKPEQGCCITAQYNGASHRLRCLAALVEQTKDSEALFKKITKFSHDCEKLTRKRNRVVHDPVAWDYEDNTAINLRAIADKRLDFGIRVETQSQPEGHGGSEAYG